MSDFAKDINVPNNDCISRQAAIDALCNDYCGGHQDCKYYPNCENLRSVQKLPSAQPAEPKRGKWIMSNVGDTFMTDAPKIIYCSSCNVCAPYATNYCPMCGADMRGEQDG